MLFILYHLRDSHASGTHVLRGLLFLYQKCATSHKKEMMNMARPKKYPKLPNGYGSIKKLSGNRRNPFAVYPPATELIAPGQYAPVKAICYVDDYMKGFSVLTAYHAGTYYPGFERFQFTPLREGLQQKSTIFLSVFCCFLFIKYIFQKLILSNSKFNQYRPYICAIFIAPISWDFMYGKYMRKIL